jgi:hypothetical protein
VQTRIESGCRALRKPGEGETGLLKPSAGEQFVEKGIENGGRIAQSRQQLFRCPVVQAEPLAAGGRVITGKRRVGGDEFRIRKQVPPSMREEEKVAAIGGDPVQENDYRVRLAARNGCEPWSVPLHRRLLRNSPALAAPGLRSLRFWFRPEI